MKRLFWILVSISISTGVYYTIRYGLRPKPIPVLNPTRFDDLEQIGVVLYKRLRTDVRSERAVVLGSSLDVPADNRVWEGFVKAARADREKIVVFDRLPTKSDDPGVENAVFDDAGVASGRFVAEVKKRVSGGQLILIHTLTRESSHLVEDSLTRKLEAALQHPLLSLSILRFAINAGEREAFHLACPPVGSEEGAQARLSCASDRLARQTQRRALDPKSIWSAVERHGLKEYLIFVHTAE